MVIWLRFNKCKPKKPLGFKWDSDITKILGYTYGHNIIQTLLQNWKNVRKKSERI